jgi:hypothetical protein
MSDQTMGAASGEAGVARGDDEDPAVAPTAAVAAAVAVAAAATAAAAAAGVNPPAASPLDDVAAMLTWTAPPVGGRRPTARYQHCAWRHRTELWVSHGSMNGRKLSGDPWVLDLTSMVGRDQGNRTAPGLIFKVKG